MILRRLILVFIFLIKECIAMKDVRAVIPKAVEEGKNAELLCLFDLEGERLYVVKWYKNAKEFFRYAPKEEPQMKIFDVEGVHVVEHLSNMNRIVLNDVTFATNGYYHCEMSVEAPSFFTGSAGGALEVINLPKADPIIKGLKKVYGLNETLKAECIAPKFRTPINLLWMINDVPADPVHIKRHKAHSSNNGFYSVRLGLRLLVTNQLFVDNQLRISCVIEVSNIYTRKVEEIVLLESAKEVTRTTSLPSWDDTLPVERFPFATIILTAEDNENMGSNDNKFTPSRLTASLVFIIMLWW